MKLLLTLTILTIYISTFGQVEKSNRAGTFIQYKFKGKLNPIIKQIKKDLGREQIIQENFNGRQLKFIFKKNEWAEEKLEILFWAISNENKHIVTITCFNQDGKDYLNGTLPSRLLIEEYFNGIFGKKESEDF